jgi:outer membrane receptor protein involved in Fe transport
MALNKRTSLRLRSGICLLALVTGSAVYAQEPTTDRTVEAQGQAAPAEPAADQDPSDEALITVTGTRLRSGFTTPTPVLVNTAEQLRSTAPSLTEAVQFLPVFRNSTNPRTQAQSTLREQGAAFLNLRGLTPQRTLVLVNGRRYITSGTSGAVDINTVPQDIVERVEIVTGGASAAYGSDAVAGVVNFILDNDLDGVRATVQAGVSEYGDGFSRGGSLSAGTPFADGRGHVTFSAEYMKHDQIDGIDGGDRDWFAANWGIIPSGTRRIIARPYVWSNVAPGGLITSGVLANSQFLPDGTLAPFQYGQFRTSTVMIGGSGIEQLNPLTGGLERWSVFGRGQYEFGDDVTVWAEGTMARSTIVTDTQYTFIGGGAAFQIFSDNAFLPAAVRNAMTTAGQTSFRMGRNLREFGFNHFVGQSRTMRIAGGLDWEIGGGWELSAYYMHGQNKFHNVTENLPINRNLYAAVDAVVNPATGQIVCRSTLAGLDPGCVPVNLFGEGSPAAAAIDYINGAPETALTLNEDVASLVVRGSPFELPGGPLSVAGGVEYRRESAMQIADPVSLRVNSATGLRGFPTSLVGAIGGYPYANVAALDGSYSVREGFLEFEAPILRDLPGIHSLTVNGAARLINYSTVGSVWTWKAGLSWEPFADLRLRATRSRDIRAGNVIELFQGESRTLQIAIINGTTAEVRNIRSGNPNLDPERADTFTVGAVYRPSWAPRLGLSVDFFDIKVAGAIFQLSTQQTIDQCAAGSQLACAQISTDASGFVVRTSTLNLASVKTRGIDVEASYSFDLGAGRVRLRGLLSYLDRLETTVAASTPVDRAGDIGIAAAPHFTGNLMIGYDRGSFSVDLQERFIGPGKQDVTFAPGVIADNTIGAVFYTDLSARMRFGPDDRFEVFGSLNNLFGKTPPVVPTAIAGDYRPTNFSLYDVMGRYMSLGARVRF